MASCRLLQALDLNLPFCLNNEAAQDFLIGKSGRRGEKKLARIFLELRTINHHSRISAKMPSTYKKDKPWDTDDIDKWKVSCHQGHWPVFC